MQFFFWPHQYFRLSLFLICSSKSSHKTLELDLRVIYSQIVEMVD